jgi:hypothetical protein
LSKINLLVDIPNFCTLGTTQEEERKENAKGEMGKKGPTFMLNGPTKSFPKITMLFMKCGIDSWIPI